MAGFGLFGGREDLEESVRRSLAGVMIHIRRQAVPKCRSSP